MRIKLCGLFRDEDIGFANRARPDYVGWVFAPSRRQVSTEWALRARERLDSGIVAVGVFADAPVERVIGLLRTRAIDMAQLHGSETEDYIARLQGETGAPVIRAIRVTGPDSISQHLQTRAEYLLLDAGAGQGRTFEWQWIGKPGRPFFLAGGIDLSNLDRARAHAPFAVDVSSGAETGGVKDGDKMMELTRRAHDEQG